MPLFEVEVASVEPSLVVLVIVIMITGLKVERTDPASCLCVLDRHEEAVEGRIGADADLRVQELLGDRAHVLVDLAEVEEEALSLAVVEEGGGGGEDEADDVGDESGREGAEHGS